MATVDKTTITPKMINELRDTCHDLARSKGFWDNHNPRMAQTMQLLVRMGNTPYTPETYDERSRLEYLRGIMAVTRDTTSADPRYTRAYTGEAMCDALKYADIEAAYTRSKGNEIALIHSELTEALEAYRSGNPPSEKIGDAGFSQAEEEFADAIIRILDFAGGHDLDIGGAIFAKLEYNATRPHKHGRKF